MSALVVLQAGLATTAQDLGVRGRAHLGVSRGGAFDARCHALANLAVGNAVDAMGLEVVLQGPHLEARAPCTVAWCGAPFDVDVDGAPLAPLVARALAPGQLLRVGRCTAGVRMALAFAGGVVAARGAALAPGASLALGPAPAALRVFTASPPTFTGERTRLRVTDSVHTRRFPSTSRAELAAATFVVDVASDRRGVRLGGSLLGVPSGDVTTIGVTAGALQVTPSGQAVVLGVDRATTGGYPVLAHVIRADLWLLGQLRPGASVRFEHVSFEEARRLWREGDRCG
ncbi:MAG: biotin-dependent carboxyltransferase family protein [Deltaproteobacteria bacterium]|nr:biotin-dependent carboxyltransferase family protein [Deltaproteobacteria bacterium]